jgi:hypothetical protein
MSIQPIKPLVKLACATGIAAMAILGLASPPAYAYYPCGTVTYIYSGGGRCTENCTTGVDTCSGSLTGTVRVIGACHTCA